MRVWQWLVVIPVSMVWVTGCASMPEEPVSPATAATGLTPQEFVKQVEARRAAQEAAALANKSAPGAARPVAQRAVAPVAPGAVGGAMAPFATGAQPAASQAELPPVTAAQPVAPASQSAAASDQVPMMAAAAQPTPPVSAPASIPASAPEPREPEIIQHDASIIQTVSGDADTTPPIEVAAYPAQRESWITQAAAQVAAGPAAEAEPSNPPPITAAPGQAFAFPEPSVETESPIEAGQEELAAAAPPRTKPLPPAPPADFVPARNAAGPDTESAPFPASTYSYQMPPAAAQPVAEPAREMRQVPTPPAQSVAQSSRTYPGNPYSNSNRPTADPPVVNPPVINQPVVHQPVSQGASGAPAQGPRPMAAASWSWTWQQQMQQMQHRQRPVCLGCAGGHAH